MKAKVPKTHVAAMSATIQTTPIIIIRLWIKQPSHSVSQETTISCDRKIKPTNLNRNLLPRKEKILLMKDFKELKLFSESYSVAISSLTSIMVSFLHLILPSKKSMVLTVYKWVLLDPLSTLVMWLVLS